MFNSRDESLCVICDVGSATVSVGLVLFTKHTKPKILATTRIPISITETPDVNNLQEQMMGYIKRAFTIMGTDGLTFAHTRGVKGKKIDKVFMVLASPWYAAKTSRVLIQKDEPFELDTTIISAAVSGEEKQFEQDAIGGVYDQVKGQDVRMIERETVKVLLNGYETLYPFNKKATSAELSLYMSLIPEHIVKEVEQMAKDILRTDRVIFHTFPLAFFGAVLNLFPHDHDYVLVDVAGESTDISLVRKGTIESSQSCTSGRNELIRTLMRELSITPDIAESYLGMYAAQSIDDELHGQIEAALKKNSEEWTSQITNTLKDLSLHSHIPHSCFLVCDESVTDLYLERIRTCGVALGISKVLAITPEILVSHVELEKHIKPDQCISLEALYIQNYKIHTQQ